MPKRSNAFQNLFFRIQKTLIGQDATVEESAEVYNHASERKDEIDVLITFQHSGYDFRTGIQCRDHSRPAGPSWIRDLRQQRDDCGLDKMVAVHALGFTEPAMRAAKKHGVETLTLQEAESSDWARYGPRTIHFSIPPLIKKIILVPALDAPDGHDANPIVEGQVACKCHKRRIGSPAQLVRRFSVGKTSSHNSAKR